MTQPASFAASKGRHRFAHRCTVAFIQSRQPRRRNDLHCRGRLAMVCEERKAGPRAFQISHRLTHHDTVTRAGHAGSSSMSGDQTIPTVPANFMQAGMQALLIDRVTAEVHGALAAAGIPNIVLKGPAIGNWLYHRDEVRGYGDSDLLVPHDRWRDAGKVLAERAFATSRRTWRIRAWSPSRRIPWFRGDQDVDLHSTIYGIEAPPEAVWAVLSEDIATMEIGGEGLPVLGEPARALHVALHAAQHQDGKAVHDLEKAVAQLPERRGGSPPTWRSGSGRCQRSPPGCGSSTDGEALARRIGIDHAQDA